MVPSGDNSVMPQLVLHGDAKPPLDAFHQRGRHRRAADNDALERRQFSARRLQIFDDAKP